jgi:hypothetical protein
MKNPFSKPIFRIIGPIEAELTSLPGTLSDRLQPNQGDALDQFPFFSMKNDGMKIK